MRGSSCCNQGGHGRVKCVSNQAESLPSIYIYVTFFNLSNISFPPPHLRLYTSSVVVVFECLSLVSCCQLGAMRVPYRRILRCYNPNTS